MSTVRLPKPITLLGGNDSISREKAKDAATSAIIMQYPDAEIERFDPEQYTLSIFAERMLTTSMFQAVRIFIVHDVHTFKKDDLDILTSLFPYASADMFIILETDRSTKKGRKENALQ